MGYLVLQMLFCLLLAFLVGALIGWWMRSVSCRRRTEALERSWQDRLDACQADLKNARDSEAKAAADAVAAAKATEAAKLKTANATRNVATAQTLATQMSDAAEAAELKAKTASNAVAKAEAQAAEATTKLAAAKAKAATTIETAESRFASLDRDVQDAQAKLDDASRLASAAETKTAQVMSQLRACESKFAAADQARRDAEANAAQLAEALAAAETQTASAVSSSEAPSAGTVAAVAAGFAKLDTDPSAKRRDGSKDNVKDDLKKVEGIGPKIEQLLNADGIATWAQLAAADDALLRNILKRAGDRFRMHDPQTWPDQAKLAHEGRWDELKTLQDLLDGGRAH